MDVAIGKGEEREALTGCDNPATVHLARAGCLFSPATSFQDQALPAPGHAFLANLLRLQVLTADCWRRFCEENGDRLGDFTTAERLGAALRQGGFLTQYQLDRIFSGNTHGLILGNHRILDRLGSGGMGAVFRGEHLLKRLVAIKVLPVDEDCPPMHLERFYAEMRVLAELHHPNIVMAYDAGNLLPPSPGMSTLLYLAMELVDGCDLDRHAKTARPAIGQACDWIRQVACGLQEAHDHELVHRDIKPSNMLMTKKGKVKLVDFGLVRQFSHRLTDPNAIVGTLEFMAPEQSLDPSNVGIHADIFGLGASLFWLLTGQTPFPPGQSISEKLKILRQGRPRRLRVFRQDAPRELEEVLDRLLDPDPTRRPGLPVTVMKALEPFASK